MQTILLTIWPFLNLLLIVGIVSALTRYVAQFGKNRLYALSASMVLFVCSSIIIPSVVRGPEGEHTFVFLQPQTDIPLTTQAYHDGVLLNSPTFTIKSHVAVWPVKLPNTLQPTEPGVGPAPDALQIKLLINATHMMPGLQWIPQNTSVQMLPNRQLVYKTSGFITWRLLGLPLYNQPKEYVGYVKI